MPTFPKYRGELPQSLNPCNLRHYWLLAYWVYFRPTALHCYLYQAAPECYRRRGLSKVRSTWHIPAYRNLYLMAPVAVLLFALLVGLVVGLYLLWTLQSHTNSVNAVAVTPDGKQAVSASDDNTLKVWDINSGQLQHTLRGHTNSVNAVAVTPDGKQAVSASDDNTLKVWDINSGQLQHTLRGHTNSVNAVAVTPDGKQAVSASDDNTLKVWDINSGQLQHTLRGHTNSVNAVAVTPDGKQAVSASWDNTLKVWDINSGQLQHTLRGHSDWVNAVAVTPDGKQAVSASDDNTLKVWDINSGQLQHTLRGNTKWVNAVAVTPDGKQAVSASKTLKVWDINSGQLQHTLRGHSNSVKAVAVTPDGKQAVSASWDNTLKVWDINSGQLQYTLRGHSNSVKAVAVTPDGKQAISASDDNTLKIWDINSGTAVSLRWAKVRLVALGLAVVMLCSFAIINVALVFTVILVLGEITFDVTDRSSAGLVGSVVFSVGLGTASSLVFYVLAISNEFNTLGVPIPFDKTFTTAFGIAFSIAFGMTLSVTLSSFSRRASGALGSVMAILIIGVVAGLAIGVFTGVQLPAQEKVFAQGKEVIRTRTVSKRINTGFDTGSQVVISTASFALLVQLGNSRLLFYPLQLALALCSQFQSRRHPVMWDELTVLPLPGTRQLLSQRLQQNEAAGLELVSEVVRNPCQRWVAQQALQIYLHTQVAPLHLLYKLLSHPDLNTYLVAPVSKQDWERMPTTGRLLIGEIAGQWVDCIPGWFNHFSERLLWYITRFRRDRRQTPLTRFAGMLYRLLDEKTFNVESFALGSYHSIYARLTDYPGGVEIEQSFDAITSFLSYKKLSNLPAAIDFVGAHSCVFLQADDTAIRPTVLKALNHLRDIGSEVATYIAATSRVNKQAAILRATDALKTLDEYVAAEVVPPEQTLLQRIIRQWSKLVIEEGGEVGRDEIIEPVANPYVVGNPVTSHLFVGREDIMRRLEELWMVTGQCSSVVIYGHRRMGKSSILRNLGANLGSQTTVVDFNMQRVGLVDTTGELLYNFALAIYDALPVALQNQLGEPDEEQFTTHNPYTALDRFLKQLDPVRAAQRFIITIDEFELIEQLIEQKRLEPRLLDFWRGLIQTYPWFVLAFAGLHTLQEMTQNYWNPIFGSVTAIPVSFLSPKAAERLIVQPSPDFNLDYDAEAIAEITQLTNGQPYLIQLIGHTLVTRFNRQMFEEDIERERRFTLEDVQAVINTPEFYRDGNAYFNGVWVQAENSEPGGQTDILEALSHQGLSITELADMTHLSLAQVQVALETLQRHDVVIQYDEQYLYTVELMRRWVVSFLSSKQSSTD